MTEDRAIIVARIVDLMAEGDTMRAIAARAWPEAGSSATMLSRYLSESDSKTSSRAIRAPAYVALIKACRMKIVPDDE